MLGRHMVGYVRRYTLFGLLFGVTVSVGAVVAAVAAWPVLVAAAWGYGLAWLRGWPPRRLAAAAWCVPMLVTLLVAAGLRGGLHAALTAPYTGWLRAWRAVLAGRLVTAAVVIVPWAVPAGLLLAGLVWWWRIGLMEAGAAGWAVLSPEVFDDRQWWRACRTAAARVRAPGGVPLLSRRGNPVVGAVIRAVGHRPGALLELGYGAVRNHMLIVGTTGAGKTTALVRLWAGFWAAASRWHGRGREARPWLVVIDAKGGFDSRDTARRARGVLRDVGAEHVAIWPDEVALNLWALPAGRLAEVLVDMVPVAAEGPAAYYADVLAAVVTLAVCAPEGPPASSAKFLSRLDGRWLARAYTGMADQAARVRAAGKHVGDVRLRYETLFTRLGPGFDGRHAVTDFDVLYCVVEGTGGTAVAEAQAQALVELVADAAVSWGPGGGERRAGLLALDEFSAVAGRVPLYELTERCRSLGLAVQVAAQSWQSLGPTADERARLAATAAGGVLIMRSPGPEELASLAGTRRVVEVGRRIVGPRGRYGDEGTGRVQYAWVVDPDRVRGFGPGQAAFVAGNGCTYVQIAPYRQSPLPLPAVERPAAVPVAEVGPRDPVAVRPGPWRMTRWMRYSGAVSRGERAGRRCVRGARAAVRPRPYRR